MLHSFRIFKFSIKKTSKLYPEFLSFLEKENIPEETDIYTNNYDTNYSHFFDLILIIGKNNFKILKKNKIIWIKNEIYKISFFISYFGKILEFKKDFKLKFYTENECKNCFDKMNFCFFKINNENDIERLRIYNEILSKFKNVNKVDKRNYLELKNEFKRIAEKEIINKKDK